MSKSYFRSDGNGGYVIGKNTLATILTIMTILGFVASSALAWGTMQEKVETLEENWEEAYPIIIENDKQIAVAYEKFEDIDNKLELIQDHFN